MSKLEKYASILYCMIELVGFNFVLRCLEGRNWEHRMFIISKDGAAYELVTGSYSSFPTLASWCILVRVALIHE